MELEVDITTRTSEERENILTKVFDLILPGAMSAATLIVVSGYTTSVKLAVASMCIGVAFSGLLHSGYEVNVLDIAPGVSGIVMGISNTAGTIMGFLSPLLVGVMTEGKVSSIEQALQMFRKISYLYDITQDSSDIDKTVNNHGI